MTHRTVKRRLESLKPVEEAGPGRGTFYQSEEAWPLIFEKAPKAGGTEVDGKVVTLNEARTMESLSKTRLNQIEEETKLKQRIPIEVANEAMDAAFGEIKVIIEKSTLPEIEKKQIRDELTSIPERLKW